jgi:hypothetical protein
MQFRQGFCYAKPPMTSQMMRGYPHYLHRKLYRMHFKLLTDRYLSWTNREEEHLQAKVKSFGSISLLMGGSLLMMGLKLMLLRSLDGVGLEMKTHGYIWTYIGKIGEWMQHESLQQMQSIDIFIPIIIPVSWYLQFHSWMCFISLSWWVFFVFCLARVIG